MFDKIATASVSVGCYFCLFVCLLFSTISLEKRSHHTISQSFIAQAMCSLRAFGRCCELFGRIKHGEGRTKRDQTYSNTRNKTLSRRIQILPNSKGMQLCDEMDRAYGQSTAGDDRFEGRRGQGLFAPCGKVLTLIPKLIWHTCLKQSITGRPEIRAATSGQHLFSMSDEQVLRLSPKT